MPETSAPARYDRAFFGHHPAFVRGALREAGFGNVVVRGAGLADKVAGAVGPLGDRLPPGRALAPLLGSTVLAPLVFCAATAGDAETPLADALYACPICGSPLAGGLASPSCSTCGSTFESSEGLLDLRPRA